jgi:hypothetical protein
MRRVRLNYLNLSILKQLTSANPQPTKTKLLITMTLLKSNSITSVTPSTSTSNWRTKNSHRIHSIIQASVRSNAKKSSSNWWLTIHLNQKWNSPMTTMQRLWIRLVKWSQNRWRGCKQITDSHHHRINHCPNRLSINPLLPNRFLFLK